MKKSCRETAFLWLSEEFHVVASGVKDVFDENNRSACVNPEYSDMVSYNEFPPLTFSEDHGGTRVRKVFESFKSTQKMLNEDIGAFRVVLLESDIVFLIPELNCRLFKNDDFVFFHFGSSRESL